MNSRYIKGGIVTRIDVLSKKCELGKYFNLNLYNKKNTSYLLKEEILNKNIKSLRLELLRITNKESDFIDESDAYCLLTTGDKLLENKIVLTDNYKKYYYQNYENNCFETMFSYEFFDKSKVRIYFIPILWFIDKISIEDDMVLKLFLNNLIRKSITNELKDAFYITIIN